MRSAGKFSIRVPVVYPLVTISCMMLDIISILISRFGPHYKLITYTTMSANLMVREIGISLFLACVGLGAGKGFIETIVNEGGYMWIGYGAIITIFPLLLTGLIGRYGCKLNY